MKQLFLIFILLFISLTVQAAAPSISVTVNRTNGIAPLGVHFDATNTTDSFANGHPFLWTYFEGNFDDPVAVAAGQWQYGAKASTNMNYDNGGVMGHLYKTPGTYYPVIKACNQDGCSQWSTTITVIDPETYFVPSNTTTCIAGSGQCRTYCISSATPTPVAGENGCPIGSTVAVQADWPTILTTYACQGCRILLKKGSTFTYDFSPVPTITADGPGIISSYGTTGARPKIQCTEGGPNPTSGDTSIAISFNLYASTNYDFGDWRIMHLEFNGGGFDGTAGLTHSGAHRRITIYDNIFDDFATVLGFSGTDYANNNGGATKDYRSQKSQELFVIENIVGGNTTGLPNSGTTAFNQGNYYVFMGNYFRGAGTLYRYNESDSIISNCGGGHDQPCNSSHLLRFTYTYKLVLAHNHVLAPGGDRLSIKMHAPFRCSTHRTNSGSNCTALGLNIGDPAWGDDGGSNNSTAIAGVGNWETSYNRIADNYISHVDGTTTATNVTMIHIGPQDSGEDERGHDIVIERNIEVGGSYSYSLQDINWPYVSFRNNIAIATAANYSSVIQAEQQGYQQTIPDPLYVFNNSFYKINAGGGTIGDINLVYLPGNLGGDPWYGYAANVIITNNIVYTPNSTSGVPRIMYSTGTPTGVIQTTNTPNSNMVTTSPSFYSPNTTPYAGINYRPTVTSGYPSSSDGTTNGTDIFIARWDFYNCKDKNGYMRLGALVPKISARCSGGR